MRIEGGEGVALTKGKRSIKSFEWSTDGKQIAFVAQRPLTESEFCDLSCAKSYSIKSAHWVRYGSRSYG